MLKERSCCAGACFGQAALLLFVILSLLVMPGCGSMDKFFTFVGVGGGSSSPDTPEGMAAQAMDDFSRAKYKDALKMFEEIKERFPFSQHSLLAELKAADCNYYLDQYAEAAVLYEEYLSNHPTNEAVPYVMFQKAMSHYKQIDTIDRDPGAAAEAIAAFAKLLKAHPNTSYTEEVRAKVKAARNFLANHEFYVASFYIRTEELDQAEARLRYILLNYPDTAIAEKADIIVADIAAGNPPQRTWRDWIPDVALPDWHTFTSLAAGAGRGIAPSN